MKAVIDTNVLLVANGQHADVSPACVMACVTRLQALQREGVAVIDDGFRILGEYLKKTSLNPPKGVGDVFLKWLLRNVDIARHVEKIPLTETGPDKFKEFPVPELEAAFDAPDRKFVAVAHAHAGKPSVWQAADCKWLDWWRDLRLHDVRVEFLCPSDVVCFHRKKFPGSPEPDLPAD